MRFILEIIFCLLVSSITFADEKPKPNTLTPKEVADGWILLFDGETTFGWSSDHICECKDGVLHLGGSIAGKLTSTSQFGEFKLEFEYLIKGKGTAQLCFDQSSFSFTDLGTGNDWISANFESRVGELAFSNSEPNGLMQSEIKTDSSKRISCSYLSLTTPENVQVVIRNVKLKPLGPKAIFNGKDLSGWKEHPGKKTKFSVTKEGWLHLQDGPGDLQTEGQWDNFILQAECKTNAAGLNSGIFFRCLPGEYQQGYEAQIHNGFTTKTEKEYAILEYDPKTNQLIDTKKVKYTATDYGTGGIYRRMPARREAAKDQEWFTMTVVAQGRHIATWVNGIRVVDWVDNRPLKDNAREGCRLKKGAISLQGHDPTTDISFRNVRIAELPRNASTQAP
jgi:hypothetical protein